MQETENGLICDRAFFESLAENGWDEQAFGKYFPVLAHWGRKEMTAHYFELGDRQMVSRYNEAEKAQKLPSKIRDKIEFLVKIRLDQLCQPDHETGAQAFRFLVRPPQILLSQKLLWRSADQMWNCIGDRSTDHNWYTKRSILSSVIGSTSLVWLGDEGDFTQTYAFLSRRIENVMQFEKFKAELPDISGAFETSVASLASWRYGK